jgi:ribosomal protein S18 acetylase RimI-like enzyme
MVTNTDPEVEPVVTRHGTLSTRPETAADGAFLAALFNSVKAPGFALLPVAEPMRRQLLDMQFRAMNMGYRGQYPAGRFEVVTLDDTLIGQLITDSGPDLFQIVYIALMPEWRGRGIATALMTPVLEQPRRHGLRCVATVAPDNVASIRLWSRLGFVERDRGDTDLVMEWRAA